MSTAVERNAVWYTREYLRMVAATYASNVLTVEFEDGFRTRVHISELDLDSTTVPDWNRMIVAAYELVIPSNAGNIEIPWDVIRALSDPAFEQHLATKAAEQAHRIGRRLRKLRSDQGIDTAELATRAEVAVDQLERIERGEDGVSLPVLERVLHVMGCDWHDLARETPAI